MFLDVLCQCKKTIFEYFVLSFYKINFLSFVQPAPIQQQQLQQQLPVQQPPESIPLTDEDISNLMEMFPNVDKDVISSIGEANRGDKTTTINSLLQLTN